MKAGKVHRVPLFDSALRLLAGLAADSGCFPESFIFPGVKLDRPLSNMSMEMLPSTAPAPCSATLGEETDSIREVAEAALAHVVGSAVELAYRRGDALSKRRSMMDEWDR